MSRILKGLAVGGLVLAGTVGFANEVLAQRSGVEVWSANCGRCHTLQAPNRYYPKDWASIGTHMAVTARLTGAEADVVKAFLISGARRTEEGTQAIAAQAPSQSFLMRAVFVQQTEMKPEEAYSRYCASCHGEDGHGDGPAAVIFDPKPGDWGDREFWQQRTDLQIDSTITFGRGQMPPLGSAMSPEMTKVLIKYLREKYAGRLVRRAERR